MAERQRSYVRARRAAVVAAAGAAGWAPVASAASYAPQRTLPFTGLNQPYGVAVDSAGDVYVANQDGGSNGTGEIDELPAVS